MSIKNLKKTDFLSFNGKNIKKLRKIFDISVSQLSAYGKISIETLKNYEKNTAIPILENLIKLSNYFNISIDFVLLWNKSKYIKNIKLLSLAEKIDKMDFNERYKVEATASSLIGNLKSSDDISKQDDNISDLTKNINENIKMLRIKKDIPQQKLAELIGVNQSQIAHYQNKSIPPAEKLLKLSDILNLSVHALSTGQNLFFNFNNRDLQNTILKADKYLSLEHQKFLIELMEAILQNKPA